MEKELVYKIPKQLNPEDLRNLKGAEGTILNPVEDLNGNWVVSMSTWENPEFAAIKRKYRELLIGFEIIEWAGRKLPPELMK